jgi:hypothetical protein
MPAPKVKAAPSGAGATKTSKGGKSSSGTSTPVAPSPAADENETGPAASSGRPDKAAYDAEQEKLKKDIDAVQAKLVCTPARQQVV